MTTMIETTTQVYQVFIKATPEQIFEAITNPAFTQKYFYGTRADYDLRPGGKYLSLAGDSDAPMVDGEVVEVDPPRKLVQTWRFLYDPELTAEGYTNVTWDIDEVEGAEGVSKLTVTHALEGAAKSAEHVAGGWSLILSGLKTLLETGKPLT
ncbi:MAG: hypothetical protein QOE91_369 [Gaiellaceae bacterium]|jgi:uncharacterized protein YndB with AHSA1/START domain|nr:hypothetical protein [Gaiellaceae bacterium]